MASSQTQPAGSTNGDRPFIDALRPEPAIRREKPRYWLASALLLATLVTTLLAGAQLQSDFVNNNPPFSFSHGLLPVAWVLEQPSRLLLGLPFSGTLLLILLSHEMGHFVACRYYGVQATLPYFIPVPWPIGTMGAFIRITSPLPSRAALFDVGVAGPITGFLVAVPALVAGLRLSKSAHGLVRASDWHVGYPAIFHLARLGAGIHGSMHDLNLHPVAMAAWVGMFATMLNLLPGGQLDGGHILYALWPASHRRITRAATLLLFLVGPFLWWGWWVWAGVLLLFRGYHPYVPEQPSLNTDRKWLAGFALLIFVLTFMPTPLPGGTVEWHDVQKLLSWMRH